jgi:hypothetical protein
MMIDHDSLTVISVDIHGSVITWHGLIKNALETNRSLGRIDTGVADGARR